jgi:hypothetical protein
MRFDLPNLAFRSFDSCVHSARSTKCRDRVTNSIANFAALSLYLLLMLLILNLYLLHRIRSCIHSFHELLSCSFVNHDTHFFDRNRSICFLIGQYVANSFLVIQTCIVLISMQCSCKQYVLRSEHCSK